MLYCGLDLSQAPDNGYIMAIYKTGVEFGEWNGTFPWENKYNEKDLLEIHIFDDKKEYRAVRSVRENGGFIMNTITDADCRKDYNSFPVETQTLENKMLLLGEEWAGSGNGYYSVKESGREKIIYLNKTKEDFEKGIYLRVIDYFDFDENMLMYHSGYRMAGITVGNGGDKNAES